MLMCVTCGHARVPSVGALLGWWRVSSRVATLLGWVTPLLLGRVALLLGWVALRLLTMASHDRGGHVTDQALVRSSGLRRCVGVPRGGALLRWIAAWWLIVRIHLHTKP